MDKRLFLSEGSSAGSGSVLAGFCPLLHSQRLQLGSTLHLRSLPGSGLQPGPGFGSVSVVPRLLVQSTALGCVSPCVSPDTSPEMRGG